MSEKMISKEKMDFTIDLLITMTVEEIAEETGLDSKDVLKDFLHSKKEGHCMIQAQSFGGMDRLILQNFIWKS